LRLDGGLAMLLLYEDGRMELVYHSASVQPHGVTINLPSPPVAAVGRGDEAAVLLRDGRVALIAPGRQELRWVSPSHIAAGELPARAAEIDFFFDDRGIYILTRTGATGFMEDGRRLWFVQIRGAAAVPSFGDDGILYSGGADWILNAYRLEDHVRAQQRILYGMLPAGDYGTGNPAPSVWTGYFFRFEERAMEARFNAIRQSIQTGNVGSAEKEYKAWLMEIAGGALPNARNPGSRQPGILQRMEAARLLSFIGSRETIPFLTALFNHDPEPFVRAAAAQAIGRIGVDPDGIAMQAFANAILPPSPLRHEGILTAVAGAIGALCRFSGPPLSAAGIRLLTVLAAHYEFPLAQRQARAEMASLMR